MPENDSSGLDASEIHAIAACGHRRRLDAGKVIFERGDVATSFYVVLEGSVDLVFDDSRSRKRLGPGSFFGELAFLGSGHCRTASAVASSDGLAAELDGDATERLLELHPRIFVSLLRKSCSYLVDSERRLATDLAKRNRELEAALDFLRRTREELDSKELLAQTDELTGIYNRRCFNIQFPKFIERASRTGFPLALVLVDLDRFKEINDSHGHATGDAVLRRVADALRSNVRSIDLPCRIGGDEFAVLLADLPSEEAAAARLESIFGALSGLPVATPAGTVRVSSSLGGAIWKAGESAERLSERADESLYQAKAAGRNCPVWEGRPLPVRPG